MRARGGVPAQLPPLLPAGVALVAGSGAVLLARRRFRTSLSEPPVPPDHEVGIPIRSGWADPAHARTYAGRPDGSAEPALLVVEQVLRCVAEERIEDVSLVSVREGRHTMALTLRAGLASQERLLQFGPHLAERLGATGTASRTPDHDILLQLSKLALLRLVVPPGDSPLAPIPLVALGVLPRGEALHVNWGELGNVLIVGLPGGGADIVLTNFLTALTARCHPDQLRLHTVATRETFPPPLFDLPHQCGCGIAPADEEGARELLSQLRAELERRMSVDTGDGVANGTLLPDLVLVLDEVADLANGNNLLDLLASQGPAHGIHAVAATTRQDALGDATLGYFSTRVVLRTMEEEESIRLLGRPDAADLGNGELFVRIDGRQPIRAHGFRVETEHLERLVDAMHAAYASAPPEMESESLMEASGDDDSDHDDEVSFEDELTPSNGAVIASEESAGIRTSTEAAPPLGIVVTEIATTNGRATDLPADIGLPSAQVGGVDLPAAASRARIQIRCFGELEVFGDGRTLSAQGQYLPWELMIYLALQPSVGVPKQELLRVLWPNADQDQGGRRLRAAMVRLRDVLGEQLPGLPSDVVRGERNGTCHLDPELVWSDAQQFLALRQQARRLPPEQVTSMLEQARSLHRGELFTQPHFGWMDRRLRGLTIRERYSEDHAIVTHQLAERYEAEGKLAQAAPLYAALLRSQPTLQDVARRLYCCYAKLQDRTALQREHRRLIAELDRLRQQAAPAQAASGAFALEPETVAAYTEALAVLGGARERIGVP